MIAGYQAARAELLERLRGQPELARLRIDDAEDWLVGFCDAWAALAEVFGFYQERILEEAFLATAQQPSSVELIYHSLGHRFPPNAAATTALAYHLSPKVAGVEAVGRVRGQGGTGASPEERARRAVGGIATPAAGPGGSVPAGVGVTGLGGAAGATAGANGGPGAGGLGAGVGAVPAGAPGSAAALAGGGLNAPASIVPPPPSTPTGIAMPGGALSGAGVGGAGGAAGFGGAAGLGGAGGFGGAGGGGLAGLAGAGGLTGGTGLAGLAEAGGLAGGGLAGLPGVGGLTGGTGLAGAGGFAGGGGLPGSGGPAIPTGARPTGGRPFVGTPAGIASGPPPAPEPAPAIGVTSQIPPASQVRAIPSGSGAAPVFVTLAPLGAYVGASRLGVSTPATEPPARLTRTTTQLELAGAKTGIAAGQPVLVTATGASGAAARWVRIVTSVKPDAQRGSTRIAWATPLGTQGEPDPEAASDPVVYGFSASSALVGANAPDWSSATLAQQLATTTVEGKPLPVRGGLARSDDEGASWTLSPASTPAGADLAAVACYDTGEETVTIVAAGSAWLLRAVGNAPLSPVATGGGARRAVGYLGGTLERMLAGAAGGTVYESIDQGQTWSAVSGSAPTLHKGDDGASTVVTNQLPSATVRTVVDGKDCKVDLLAGTDAGLYGYAKGVWLPMPQVGGVSAIATPPTPALPMAVFALVPIKDGYVAATAGGIYEYGAAAGWKSKLATPASALTTAATSIYAAIAQGVAVRGPDATWSQPTSTGLPHTRITALVVAGDQLLASTAQGIYTATIPPSPGLEWTRCDHAAAFSLPDSAFDAPTGSAVPDGLYAGFADYGIALGTGAELQPAGSGYRLTDGAHQYTVTPGTGTWNVGLMDALPAANDLAVSPAGTVIAVADAATPVATAWPGFAVSGTQVEFAPPLRTVAAGVPALIEQRTVTPASRILDVTQVDQDAGVRAGRRTTLTRLTFGTALAPRLFPRAVSTVWTGAVAKPLFVPPATAVAQVAGTGLTLASQLPAPVAPGRLATVSGAPPGLAVAPLGGTFRIAAPGTTPVAEGPPQADVADIAVLPDGTVLAATAEGVFSLADGVSAQRIDGGWPGGASAGLVVAGGIALAASARGVQRLNPAVRNGPPASWTRVLATRTITALATDGTRVVACEANGAVHLAPGAAAEPDQWDAVAPALTHAATALALSADGMWAATADGVLSFAKEHGWRTLAAPAGQIACLLVDASGRLWAGGTAGVQVLDPATGTWGLDTDVAGPVAALCVTPEGRLLAYGADGVLERTGTTWQRLAAGVGSAVTALAEAPDGSWWLGTGATLPLPTLPGAGVQQVSHAPLIPALGIDATDVATLAQGAVPDRLLAAFADAGSPLDSTHVVVDADGPDCWLIRVGAQLSVVALRRSAANPPVLTVTVHRNQAVLHPTGAPTTADGVQTWPIEVGGVAATLVAPASWIVSLPADADSPALAESATLAAPPGGGEPAVTNVGAGTALTFTQPLTHVYDASTVQVDLNVVPAAQGQPVSVPIGSGDPKAANQRFPVPTPVVAIGSTTATPTTTLRVYVDGQPWNEVSSLHRAGPDAPVYVVQHNADGSATVSFGDGEHGARLPAGHDNVVATYLQGGGAGGEVARGTLIQPLTRPQLVKAVHNPLAALIPATPALVPSRMAAVRGLDRVVTHGDYEDLAAAQPGVALAAAELIAAAFGRALVITIAGAASAPADLARRVQQQLGTTAPSGVPVRVASARLVGVSVALEVVSTAPAHALEVALRAQLGGLTGRRPGGSLLASQVLAAATGVAGVTAATITGWGRDGRPALTRTQLSGAGAAWPEDSPAPLGGELLVLDADHLEVAVVAPRAVART